MKSKRYFPAMARVDSLVIKTDDGRYPVVFRSARSLLSRITRRASRVAIISNPTVFGLHGHRFIRETLPTGLPVTPIMMGDGERYKTRATIEKIYAHLFDVKFGRSDVIITLGGGVVGDTGGFVAATYMRGVPFVQAPTTLLAMVDASVGGKVGINHRAGKNLIGAFYQPGAVIIRTETLATLGERQLTEGMAEIIKSGFLSSRSFLNRAMENEITPDRIGSKETRRLIEAAIRFKAKVVAQDTRERNLRAVLNFGHTFAHAIEKVEQYRRYHHGEAVLIGMAAALFLSRATRRLTPARFREYVSLIQPYFARLKPLNKSINDYIAPMIVDKKNEHGKVRFVLLREIGRPIVAPVVDHGAIRDAVDFMKCCSRGQDVI